MEVIDAQVHVWEAHPGEGWDPTYSHGAAPHDEAFEIEDALAQMDALGIDAAVLSIPPGYRRPLGDGVYRIDNTYAEQAALRHPGRFVSVARYDPRDPDLDDLVAGTRSRPGTLGLRTTFVVEQDYEKLAAGVYERLFAAVERHDVPLMLATLGHLDVVAPIVEAHPAMTLVVDHLGLRQPPFYDPGPEPWVQLPLLLALARYPNVSVKLGGVPTLSHEPYPYRDVWPHVRAIIDAFGPERLMWASDVTRVREHHTWAEALDWLRESDELSASEKELILGGSLRRILRWERAEEAAAKGG